MILLFGVCEKSFLEKIKNENVKIHLEIDTGMGRTGIKPEEFSEFLGKIKNFKNIQIEGIYTHFSSADIDFDYTEKQIERFEYCEKIAKQKISSLKYIHASASNGILNFPKANYNLVRPGLILYGYESCENTYEKIELKPVAKLKSKITFIKDVEKGESISYSRKFISDKQMKIATIPIGYADGISRSLSNKGFVIINKQKAKILGNICMDSLMIDVTNIPDVKIGTEVYIWDNEIIKLEEIAKEQNTINYEILSRISERVPRVFKR